MESNGKSPMTRRGFVAAGATAFMVVPRHVLGGAGYTAPSDKVTIALVGAGRQGISIMMELMTLPDVQIVSVCDCNNLSKDYVEYSTNALLEAERKLLGPGFENWSEDLASPGERQVSHRFRYSVGAGGREPARRVVEAYYGKRMGSGTYKGCATYRDYREMLDKSQDTDAVYVATPDHWHAPISIAAMRKGKHVLCQKPMTHSIGEAWRMAQVARETKVATAVTVNNPSTPATKTLMAWLSDGAIGKVHEVHNWSSRPFWPQGIDRPEAGETIPEGLDWDMWVGPAEARPYSKAYLPFIWRGWNDFGCGSFGDMGCYSFAGLFKILNLTPPTAVESTTSEHFAETYPKASLVNLDFPANGGRQALRLAWYDGGLMPPRPAGLRPEDEHRFAKNEEGIMYVGDKGFILAGFNGEQARVYPENRKYQPPKPRTEDEDERHDEAVMQWIAACKGGPATNSTFESQAPVTEALLLGCIAQRVPWEKLQWDTAAKRVKNSETATKLVDPPYRSGFSA